MNAMMGPVSMATKGSAGRTPGRMRPEISREEDSKREKAMYREHIEAAAVGTRWIKVGAPCPEEKIAEAECCIGFAFPAALKELLREMDGDGNFLLSADGMMENVRMNREYFTECFEDPEEYLERIDRHIFFAANGCGDYYCYRIGEDGRADESEIYLWEHEVFECRPAAKDIAELIEKYCCGEI